VQALLNREGLEFVLLEKSEGCEKEVYCSQRGEGCGAADGGIPRMPGPTSYGMVR